MSALDELLKYSEVTDNIPEDMIGYAKQELAGMIVKNAELANQNLELINKNVELANKISDLIIHIAEQGERIDKYLSFLESDDEFCPNCKGTVGHRINCPDGIAFSDRKYMPESNGEEERYSKGYSEG